MTDELSSGASAKTCFVITPIGAPSSDTRRRSDQILKHIIRPVVERLGYVARRADEIDQAGLITTQILDRILNDDLVIADLTDQNPNVFYELAVRHAIRKPFVQLMAAEQKIPFDVQGLRTIGVDYRDLDSVASAKEQLANTIKGIEEGSPVETPMSVALNLQDLKGSESPEEQGLSQIMELLQQLRSDVRPLRSRSGVYSPDFHRLRRLVKELAREGRLSVTELEGLIDSETSATFDNWIRKVVAEDLASDEPPF
jgi:hypothetical protein